MSAERKGRLGSAADKCAALPGGVRLLLGAFRDSACPSPQRFCFAIVFLSAVPKHAIVLCDSVLRLWCFRLLGCDSKACVCDSDMRFRFQ
eukprot:1536213-Alexandrium_andersonii.AAC.1